MAKSIESGHLYSKPAEQAGRLSEKLRDSESFIEALELALNSQKEAIARFQEMDDISEEERIIKMEGIEKNIKDILSRIEEVKLLRNEQSAEIARLRRLHDVGLELLKSINTSTKGAN